MTRGYKALCALSGGLLLLSAVCRFALPGVRFSALLAACLAMVPLLGIVLDRWSKKSETGALLKRAFLVGLTFCMGLFLAAEIYIFTGAKADKSDRPVSAVIVLGAGVNGTTPSLALRTRIQAAEQYLKEHPDLPVVLSGGRGAGEEITEAEAMRRALTADGVAPERLLLEERSTDTEENFAYSKALLEECGIDTGTAAVAVVTNDFHLRRARLLAERRGLTVLGVPAELPWRWLSANYYIREAFGLTKLLL